ncbi:CLUMA_CG006395, isoform A [Clunio marinus]|uniref:CLUMA_CG006395, isoform A n=1 Tax=Clunio marinus TaxID=568069 RepID=A0A1J1HXL2_9DIPT|nr:CLUMA_CG006395, isoform A [Clunio marinus]
MPVLCCDYNNDNDEEKIDVKNWKFGETQQISVIKTEKTYRSFRYVDVKICGNFYLSFIFLSV